MRAVRCEWNGRGEPVSLSYKTTSGIERSCKLNAKDIAEVAAVASVVRSLVERKRTDAVVAELCREWAAASKARQEIEFPLVPLNHPSICGPARTRGAVRLQLAAMLSLPREKRQLSVIVEHTVAADDPCVALRGQKGVLAAAAIPAGTVVAEFQGQLVIDGCFRADLALGFSLKGCKHRFAIDPSVDGNIAGLINDYRTDAANPDSKANDVRRINVEFLVVLHRGAPSCFVVTNRAVRAGEWILLNYGATYFDSDMTQRKT